MEHTDFDRPVASAVHSASAKEASEEKRTRFTDGSGTEDYRTANLGAEAGRDCKAYGSLASGDLSCDPQDLHKGRTEQHDGQQDRSADTLGLLARLGRTPAGGSAGRDPRAYSEAAQNQGTGQALVVADASDEAVTATGAEVRQV